MSTETETDTPAPSRAPQRVTDKSAWGKRAVHEVTLPSGAIVEIKLPNLGQLIKSGNIPNSLLDSALEVENAKEVTKDLIEKNFEFATYIVPRTVVSPEITEDDVLDGSIPAEDVELIVAFASRRTDMDAANRHIGGLDTVQSFRDARHIFSLNPDGDGL